VRGWKLHSRQYRALALFVRGSGAEMATKVYLALLATVNVGG
jgi:hypothetical protein